MRTLILSLLMASSGTAAVAPPSAREIADSLKQSYSGFVGQRVDAALTLRDQHGGERVVEFTQLWLEAHPEDGVGRSLIRFKAPKDLAGTALLTREVQGGRDDIWLFLAETKELKRVDGTGRANAFLGSEVSFEDLSLPIPDRYEYRLTGEGTAEGRPCWEVVRTPKFPDSGYSRIEACIDKERFIELRVRYFDRAGQLMKVGTASDFHEYAGKKWRPHRLEVKNVQTGRSTLVVTQSFKMGLTLSPKLFEVAQLRKR